MAAGGQKPNKLMETVLRPGDYLPCPNGKSVDFLEKWHRITRDFPADYFRASDTEILAQYVDLCLRKSEIEHILDDEGYVVDTPTGTKANPMVQVLSQLSKDVLASARALRIGPSTRLQMSQVPKVPAAAPTKPDGASAKVRRLHLAGVDD